MIDTFLEGLYEIMKITQKQNGKDQNIGYDMIARCFGLEILTDIIVFYMCSAYE